MAKGLRSHPKQKNKSVLRKNVFTPVIDARTERLSKKLKELASQPWKGENEGEGMEVDKPEENDGQTEPGDNAAMEVDEPQKSSSGKIQKRNRKKTRKSITFKKHPLNTRAGRLGKKK